jgi:D-alanyl-D-alanine carboxypeptidase
MRFGFASNTKLFIAVTLAKLQEQEVLSLDDHLYLWLPSYQYVDSTTTIRQLLSHQSGIFDFWNDNINGFWNMIEADTAHFWTPQEVLATIGAPHFAPGNGYRYSNTNYLLAGMVIEAATGTSWVQKLHDIILNPLTMDSTFIGAFEPRNGPVAHEWVYNMGEIVNSPMISAYSFTNASAALLSTPQEMVEWYNALLTGALISDFSLTEVLNFDQSSYYGLGIMEWMYNNHSGYGHSGAQIGCLSEILFDTKTKSLICIITNQRINNFGNILVPLLNVLFNEYPKQLNDAGISGIVTPWENTCSATIIPSVRLTNFGSAPLTSVNIHYKVDEGAASVFGWTGTLSTGDTINVVLPQINAVDGYHTFTCYSALPNGAQEGYTYNDTTKSNFIVNASGPMISVLSEGFDSPLFPPAGWSVSSSSMVQWGQTSLARSSGTGSAVRSNYNDGYIGAIYDLDLPYIQIGDATNPILDFDYAYAMYPGSTGDSLKVYISTDCGITWQVLFNKGGYALHTASNTTNPFYPQTSNQWKHESFPLGGFPGDALIRFRSVCGAGNNLFIDNVNVSFPTGIPGKKPPENFTIFPNPASGELTISGLPVNSEIQLTDLTGKLLMTQKTVNVLTTIDIHQLPSGVYVLRTSLGVKKVVKM